MEINQFSLLRHVDSEWHNSAEGESCIQQLYNSSSADGSSRKHFGLLERPNLAPGTPEITFKIGVLGKAGSGKTKTIALLSGKQGPVSAYTETVGIHVKNVYWPTQINGKVAIFRLQFWESGESSSKRYSYISSACTETVDSVAVVINRADQSSFEYAENKIDMALENAIPTVIFAIDSESEIQVQDKDLTLLARRKRSPIFYLPSQNFDSKCLAPFYNSLCDFLYSIKQNSVTPASNNAER